MAQVGWLAGECIFRNNRVLGISATESFAHDAVLEAVDLVAGFEQCHRTSNFRNDAGKIGAPDHRETKSQNVAEVAAAQLPVHGVYAGGVNPDQHTIGADARNGNILDLEDFGTTVRFGNDGKHEISY